MSAYRATIAIKSRSDSPSLSLEYCFSIGKTLPPLSITFPLLGCSAFEFRLTPRNKYLRGRRKQLKPASLIYFFLCFGESTSTATAHGHQVDNWSAVLLVIFQFVGECWFRRGIWNIW